MKKILFTLIVICSSLPLFAQEEKKEPPQKFMHITTIESVIGGGFGRSLMLITREDGSQEERSLENLFSLTGMNLKNIKNNESDILKALKTFTDEGWKLVQATPMTLSPGDRGPGIFMTRYLLSKTDEKKGF